MVTIGHIIYPDMKRIDPRVIYTLCRLVCGCDLEVQHAVIQEQDVLLLTLILH